MANLPEGWYCLSCNHYLGEIGDDEDNCPQCGGNIEYREFVWCANCKDEQLIPLGEGWECKESCEHKGHNHD